MIYDKNNRSFTSSTDFEDFIRTSNSSNNICLRINAKTKEDLLPQVDFNEIKNLFFGDCKNTNIVNLIFACFCDNKLIKASNN